MLRVLKFILIIGVLPFISKCSSAKNEIVPFGVAYNKLTAEDLKTYRLIIVEPDHYSKLEVNALNSDDHKLIAYVSLGEVDSTRWYFPLMENYGFLGVNPNWGSCHLDLSQKEVRDILIKKVIPNIMIKGFDGLFFDNVDGVGDFTERSHLQDELVLLIGEIREAYPEAFLIQNAGLFLLGETREFVDAVLVESVASSYSFEDSTYNLADDSTYEEKMRVLNQYADSLNITFLIIDFINNIVLRHQVEERLQSERHPYFLSNIELIKLPELEK